MRKNKEMITCNINSIEHERLLAKIGKGNFSKWLRNQEKVYNNVKDLNSEDFDYEINIEKINKLKQKRDKFNIEIRVLEELIENFKQKRHDLEIKRIKEAKEKSLEKNSCIECERPFSLVMESSMSGVCKNCFAMCDSKKMNEWIEKIKENSNNEGN